MKRAKPDRQEIALAKITAAGSVFRRSAVESAEAKLRQWAHGHRLSLGEQRAAILASIDGRKS